MSDCAAGGCREGSMAAIRRIGRELGYYSSQPCYRTPVQRQEWAVSRFGQGKYLGNAMLMLSKCSRIKLGIILADFSLPVACVTSKLLPFGGCS